MKFIIKNNIKKENISKHVPKQYLPVLPNDLLFKEVILIIFPCDKNEIITSKYIVKAINKINNNSMKKIYLGGCFTIESKEIIKNYNDLYFALDYFEWTDKAYFNISQ